MVFLDDKAASYNNKELFDPSLIRLNSVKKLTAYCDSLFAAVGPGNQSIGYKLDYPSLVGSIVRKRFYWGYSCYSFNDNYLAAAFSKITQWGYAATVIPNDILKYPNAACSQQSIVMMEVLKRKGFKSRKVGFLGKNKVGHFAFEVYDSKGWHFHDPTMEPDTAVLNKYDRPDIKFLASNPDILLAAYRNSNKGDSFLKDVFSNYFYGKVDEFPAPTARVFHQATKFLSDTLWIFCLAGFLITNRYRKRLEKKHHSAENQPEKEYGLAGQRMTA